jgi:NAD(P)H-nitrite reductase large subunit
MNILVLGSSAAGISAIKSLREQGFDGAITLVTADSCYYSRCQLHLLAAGKRTEKQMQLLPDGWEKGLRVDFRSGRVAVAMNAEARTVTLDDDTVLAYDRLLIATGSRTAFPPIPDLVGPLTFGLRNAEDGIALRETLAEKQSYVVIGAGLVGVELALELAHLGKTVSLLEMAPYPLPLQLEPDSGKMCAEILERAGVQVVCGDVAARVNRGPDQKPVSVSLKSGKTVAGQVVVCAAGVRSNMEFAVKAGVKADRGIIIDETCQTSIPGVFAAGDVAQTMDSLIQQVVPSAIWPTAVRQGKIAAQNMIGKPSILERNTGFKASVVLNGTPVISLGPVYQANPDWTRKVFKSTNAKGQHVMRVFYLFDGRLKAALLWGDVTNAGLYFEAIVNQRPIGPDMPWLDQLDAAKRGVEKLNVL